MRGGALVRTGGVYHLISRFVAKEWFVASAQERRAYLGLLGKAISKTTWRCFSFAVMSSHIHLALVAGTEPLRGWLRPMHTMFAQWINDMHSRIGAVIVRGPKVFDVAPSGAARLIGYLHHNPVRAGVVSQPGECDWTSHRAYAHPISRPSWLDVGLGVQLSGFAGSPKLVEWIEAVPTDRSDLDAISVGPRGRGRPRIHVP